MARRKSTLLLLILIIIAGLGYILMRRPALLSSVRHSVTPSIQRLTPPTQSSTPDTQHSAPEIQHAIPGTQPADLTGLTPFGAPNGHKADGRLLKKSHYECFHDPHLKISRWVAYEAAGVPPTGAARYSGSFYPDPDLTLGRRAEPADYKGAWKADKSGYDRGHQAPDATIKEFGPEAQRETYSLANITPQHSQVNQGVWSDLESQIRYWSSPASPVWVVTGPVFSAEQETTWIGPDRIAVPQAYYAVIAREPPVPAIQNPRAKIQNPQVLAFLIANTPDAPWYTSLSRFLVSIDSVEKLTALDFLPALPDSTERRLEATPARAVWP
jgi:endonuclease G, mitochondrial